MKSTKKLTISALCTSLSIVLFLISRIIPSPFLQGGNVTIASMVPIITVSILFGTKWGLISSLTFSLIQLILGFYPPPVQNALNFFLVVFLDYIAAFGVLGFAGVFYKLFGKNALSVSLSSLAVTVMRYICHIISGVVIWKLYANGQNVWIYSLIYNGAYMIPEIIITSIVSGICFSALKLKTIQG